MIRAYCIRFILFTGLLFAVSCQKDKGHEFTGSITAFKNGKEWKAEPTVKLIENFNTLQIQGNIYNSKGYHRELLSFKGIDFVQAKQDVDTSRYRFPGDSLTVANFYTSIDGGDVHGESYYIVQDPSIENWIELTAIEGEEVWGSFELTFYRDTTRGDPASPDTLKFENGHFHVKIDEKICCEK